MSESASTARGAAVNYTQTLLDAIGRDAGEAGAVLDAHPEAALGRGAGGESPVLVATYHGRTELAARLARARPLDVFEAAALGEVRRLGEVLEADAAAAGARSWDGWTALHLAAFFGRAGAAALLLDRGAELEAPSANATRNTPLCAAIAGAADAAVVDLLLERGADVNARAAQGITPLHVAASRGADGVARALLARGADASALLENGMTPAAMAESRGHHATAAAIGGWRPAR